MNNLCLRVLSVFFRNQKQGICVAESFRHSFKLKNISPKFSAVQKLEEIKFLASVKLTSMLQKRNISSNSDDDKQKDKPKPSPMLMNFTPVLYPSLMLCIKNWILAKFIIQPYLDTDFRMKDFNNGAKQALVIVASYLSKGDFQALKGLVADDAIAEIKGNFPSLTVQEREDLRVNLSDIGTTIPYQIGIIFDDSNQKRFAEITVTYHIIKGMEDMKVPGKVKPEHIQKNIRICNYRFIREYTKGIQSDWIINRLGHFKLCHF